MDAPKTAEQINAPQTGKIQTIASEVNPVGPSGLPPGLTFKAIPRTSQIQERYGGQPDGKKGWWSFRNISGSVAGVLAQVDKASMPEEEKASLKAAILRRCGTEFNFVTVDAECFVANNTETIHRSIEAEKKLL
jgi:hypothetical protein